ncbi:MAG: FAD/NAD(P)-binding protein [Nanoarchaeota archaeon]|nr:FAD/NAD(P)-binding protein [Nanoarchaeota archaeon]MBU1322307.1 FAD/NAD(P)-binding protein [Nanoarchaeota archaeon]MBU1597846.1 FAD/NAD(P)-binding protein [Nanoarchaeota archaeon]MBU2441099.1 FAD/NAD(P)-binding protein [Nanoarchaeota archaeon]
MLSKSTPLKIVKKEKQADKTYLFRLEGSGKKKIKFDYKIGQFYQVSVPGIGEAPISVCSFSEDFLEFNIRGVGDVTDKLLELEVGDNIWIRGPYGTSYPLDKLKGNNIMIIGGGTGIAPLRGALKYLEMHRADFERVHIFFGCRSPEEVLFKKDMHHWDRIFDLNLTVDKAPANYKGKVGLVTKIVEESGLDNRNKVVLICGPPIMMKFVIKTLESMGFHYDQIFLSHERRMKCGVGMCGHCMISGIYVCKDGPVFRYDKILGMHE